MAVENLIEISFSELRSWRRCQRQHHYKYNRNIVKKSKSLPLYKGSVVHSCLETHYSGDDWKGAHKVFKKEFSKLMEEEKAEYGDLPSEVNRMVKGYIATYKDETWTVATDKKGKPLVEREFKVRIPGTRVVVKGVIDLVVHDSDPQYKGVWVIDHKTMKDSVPSNEFRMTDIQTTLYFWVVLTLCEEWGLDTKKVRGAIFNYIRTKPPKEPDLLPTGGMSKKNIDTSWMFYKQALKENGFDPNDYKDMRTKLRGKEEEFYHRHRMDKPKTLMKQLLQEVVFSAYQIEAFGDKPARTLDRSCDWMCDYKELCFAELQGLEVESMIKTMYEERQGDGIDQRKKQKAGLKERDEI
jgi:hypothetical protein